MRLPVIPALDTKDGVTNKNARLTNVLKEKKSSEDVAALRPGLVETAFASGNGNGLVRFNDKLVAVYGDDVRVQNGVDDNVVQSVLPSTSQWRDMAASSTTLCVISSSSDAGATSSDNGVTWVSHPLPSNAGYLRVVHNGTVFCAVSAQLGGAVAATSSDEGVTWTPRTLAFLPGFSLLDTVGSLICLIDDDSRVQTSIDNGATWIDKGYIDGESTAGWSCFTATDSYFVAVNSETLSTAISTTGEAWTISTTGLSTISGVLWTATTWNGHVIMAVGFNPGTLVTYVATSTNGLDWVLTNTSTLDTAIVSRGRYITSTDSIILITTQNSDLASYSSNNGLSWTSVTLPTTGPKVWTAIAGIDGVFAGAAFFNTIGFSLVPSTLLVSAGTVESGFYDFAQSPI